MIAIKAYLLCSECDRLCEVLASLTAAFDDTGENVTDIFLSPIDTPEGWTHDDRTGVTRCPGHVEDARAKVQEQIDTEKGGR